MIETSDFTVAHLCDKTVIARNNGKPVYFDGMNFWEVDENGRINEIEIKV